MESKVYCPQKMKIYGFLMSSLWSWLLKSWSRTVCFTGRYSFKDHIIYFSGLYTLRPYQIFTLANGSTSSVLSLEKFLSNESIRVIFISDKPVVGKASDEVVLKICAWRRWSLSWNFKQVHQGCPRYRTLDKVCISWTPVAWSQDRPHSAGPFNFTAVHWL